MTIVILFAIVLAIWLFVWGITDPTPSARRSFAPAPESDWFEIQTTSSEAEIVTRVEEPAAVSGSFHVEAEDTTCHEPSSASSGGWWGGDDDSSASSGDWCSSDD
jgi:hypothetical protein